MSNTREITTPVEPVSAVMAELQAYWVALCTELRVGSEATHLFTVGAPGAAQSSAAPSCFLLNISRFLYAEAGTEGPDSDVWVVDMGTTTEEAQVRMRSWLLGMLPRLRAYENSRRNRYQVHPLLASASDDTPLT